MTTGSMIAIGYAPTERSFDVTTLDGLLPHRPVPVSRPENADRVQADCRVSMPVFNAVLATSDHL
jgi:hypothetical protein